MRLRGLIARDAMLLAGYLVITFLSVTAEVLWLLPVASKWLFVGGSAAFLTLIALSHWREALASNTSLRRTLLIGMGILWALLGGLTAIVVGTNVKFLLGGQL